MKQKITKHLHVFYKKLKKQNYTLFAIFILLFASVSFFFITRGAIPHSSELAYIEHSILGKKAGSVVPASCDAAPWYTANGDGNYSGCATIVCWDGSSVMPAMGQSCSIPANCVGTPWGTVSHGASVTGYQVTSVNAPATCPAETRSCWNGSLSGSYTNTSCVVKSGTITVPASCVIAVHDSTCTVTASWVSANLVTPRFYDNNTNTTLSSAANGSQTVWVAYGGTTFKLTDSTLYNYDTKTVSASCVTGTSWNGTTGQCEYDAIATLSANPIYISYNHDSTLTWGSTHATLCTAGGAWTNSNTLSGNGSTGALTANQTYTFQCFGLGNPSPVATANVTVCPINNPILNKDDITCQDSPGFTTEFTGQYTPNGEIVVTPTDPADVDSCKIKRDGVPIKSGTGSITANFFTAGTYSVECSYTDGNGEVIYSTDTFVVNYSPIPPPPVVSLKASPTTMSAGSPTVLTWTITYPGAVQVPSRTCTLKATAVCAGNHSSCTPSQLAAEAKANQIIQTDDTDTNDTDGSRKITSIALNDVTDTPAHISSGATDWKTNGKKTFVLDKSMDFLLDCRNAPAGPTNVNEGQSVRVQITVPVEG